MAAAAASNPWVEWHNPQVVESAASNPKWHNPQVAESAASNPKWHNPQVEVAESAAPTSDDFQDELDKAKTKDMPEQMRRAAEGEKSESEAPRCAATADEEEEEAPRRTVKLGQAYKNYRRNIAFKLAKHFAKKASFAMWLKVFRKEDICLEDLCFTEEDMDHFLNTVASWEAHEQEWKNSLRRGRTQSTDTMASRCLG